MALLNNASSHTRTVIKLLNRYISREQSLLFVVSGKAIILRGRSLLLEILLIL